MYIKNIQRQFVNALCALGTIALFIYPVINIGAQSNNWGNDTEVRLMKVFCNTYAC